MGSMKTLILSFLVMASAWAGDMKLNLVHAEQVSQWLKDTTSKTYIFDANGKDTRAKEGIVLGAQPLTSHDKFNISKELPADHSSRLVFYCGNEKCMASHHAAERAIKAGYLSVYVMSDGIMGWKKKGFETQKLN